jgi:hypothetical protein
MDMKTDDVVKRETANPSLESWRSPSRGSSRPRWKTPRHAHHKTRGYVGSFWNRILRRSGILADSKLFDDVPDGRKAQVVVFERFVQMQNDILQKRCEVWSPRPTPRSPAWTGAR